MEMGRLSPPSKHSAPAARAEGAAAPASHPRPAWFTRASIEERAGGAMVFDFGGGAESRGTVTRWQTS